MTVAELFAEAGYPIPEGAKLVCVQKTYSNAKYWAFGTPGPDGGSWARFDFDAQEYDWPLIYLYHYEVPLNNLPAKDALDALPQVIRDAYKEPNV